MERYIKKVFHTPILENVKGLFRSFVLIRDKNTRIVGGTFGEILVFEGDVQPDKEKEAIDAMMAYLEKTDIFKNGNYEFWDYGNNKWTTRDGG
ncbi:MAG: hypothetical protein IMF11_03305 [Proteobacteria bacterium]|nr:hypothetical protein [Pseudomonadota bacterium]